MALSCVFQSDKTYRYSRVIKHRSIDWKLLPPHAKVIMDAYMDSRPAEATFFFCTEDGRPLYRSDFINMLDTCLLQTDWANIKITPHAFRQGRICQESLTGQTPLDRLIYDGRWRKDSDAIEHYTRTDYCALLPSQIWKDFPEARRKWSAARLAFLSEYIVESEGAKENHPHIKAMRQHCPVQYAKIAAALPAEFPHEFVKSNMAMIKKHCNQGVFTKTHRTPEEQVMIDYDKKRLAAEKVRRR